MITKKTIADIAFDGPLYSHLSKPQMLMEQPETHLQWLENGEPAACLSIWYSDTPSYRSGKTGLIGHFNCLVAVHGASLLSAVKRDLFAKGIDWVVGPINGSSWFNYRLALKPLPKPEFLLEPWQPQEHLDAFMLAGFNIIERYFSALQTSIDFTDPRTEKARSRLINNNIHIRDIEPKNKESELFHIYQLSQESFTDNLFYRPINFDSFITLYGELLSKVPPSLCKMAFHHEQLVGLMFAYPDNRRLVIKTCAVKNDRICAGLSIVLLDEVIQAAKEIGLTEVIFALMHEKNKSKNSTTERSQPFRHYGLMGIQR